MPGVRFSNAADADLVNIIDYSIEAFGIATAEAYARSFERAFALLVDHPEAGPFHPDIDPPIRSLSHRSHRIFYEICEGGVRIQRILHKTMDASKHLAGRA